MISTGLFITLFVLLVWMIILYNRLVIDRNRVLAGWSDIDVQLKRRHDLIPKLVDAVRQYAQFETAALEAVTDIRTQSGRPDRAADIGAAEKKLSEQLLKLVALAEAYPDLKANQSFLDLQFNLTDTENQIQFARRYYNGAVRNLNVRIESFPDMLVARLFGFSPAQYFEYDGKD